MITYLGLGNYGRFGNQLWQIASTIGIARKNGQPYSFPEWEYQKYFRNFKSFNRNELRGHRFSIYNELDTYYQDIVLSNQFNWNLVGYFQSWKYFKDSDKEVRQFLDFPKLPLKGTAVHIRRGDYVDLQHIHPVLPLEYYKEAMKKFKGEFTIFSDDVQWCRENFTGRNINFYERSNNDYLDFSYMAGFERFIIANSSFSFWAAYLSGSKEVIAPSIWVNTEYHTEDRLPSSWIKI